MHLHDLALGPGADAAPHTDALLLRNGRWSRGELQDAVTAMTGPLATLAPLGGRIALVTDNRPEVVALILAIPAAGRVAVPLDPRLAPDEMVAQLDAAGVAAVIGTSEGLGRLAPFLGPAPTGRTYVGLDPGAGDISLTSLVSAPARPAATQGDPEAPAWMLFTPRNAIREVALTARDLAGAVARLAASRPLADDDVYLHPFPLDHASAIHILHALHRCRPVVLPRRLDPAEIVELIRAHDVTTLSARPSLLRALLDHRTKAGEPASALTGLRTVTCTATAPPELLAEVAALGVDIEVVDAAGLIPIADPGPDH